MSSNKRIKLPQPPLLDFSNLRKKDDVTIIIKNTTHKFATDAKLSGTDPIHQPIFGSEVYINHKKFADSTFGMPFISFPQGSKPKITYKNKTLFTFNIHYHGLNTTGSVDGTSMEVVFGHNTLLGPNVTFQFPEITNNQALLWFHSHNMFVSIELICAGAVGLLQITDKPTKWLTETFRYGDNQILLEMLDMDFTSNGTQTFANLPTGENRSCFTVVNGISAVNWYSTKPVPHVNPLFHNTSNNLVKIDILNASLNWRVFHIGVCDKDMNIKTFYLVQTDSGLVNPSELKMTFVPTAGRIAIIIDLNEFKHKIAHLFFYNYDLTETIGATLTYPDQPNNPSVTATIPDITSSPNPTPYPTPIPDPNQQNQQSDFTSLTYPVVPIIPQTQQVLDNGTAKVPKTFTIKPFLKIYWDTQTEKSKYKDDCQNENNLSLTETISRIRRTVFGSDYEQFKHILKKPCFEYDNKFNYESFLNKDYFYNLPKFCSDISSVPRRNFLLLFEGNINAVAGGNINGTTEFINGSSRIIVDMWNSAQLDLDWALQQYQTSPNNYKPPTLPSSKFRIYKTNDDYSNTAMISNDTLKIQFYSTEVAYGDFTQNPLTEVIIVFPSTDNHYLNLQQWIDLVNHTFAQTTITLNTHQTTLNTILTCDWSFFPYKYQYMYQKALYMKSAIIKTTSNSNYWIRFLGRWPLLQFFGKPLTGNTISTSATPSALLFSSLNQIKRDNMAKSFPHSKNLHITKLTNRLDANVNQNQYIKCDEIGTYGTYDTEIQQIFPFYATANGNVQLPIACMKRHAELIIPPNTTYIGMYDGYLNDNLNSFSVKLKSTEEWIYNNGDCTDSHSFHFHLTSGFALTHSTYNTPGLTRCDRSYNPLTYSRDVYQVGPQESISFYLTWPKYSSDERTSTPKIRGVGGVIHCHFLQHNDSNSMIIQYYVDPECLPTPNYGSNHAQDAVTNSNSHSLSNTKKCCKRD